MKRWWLWSVLSALAMCLATVAGWPQAQGSNGQLTWQQLEHEIWLLASFHRLRLTVEQCTQMAELIRPVIQKRDALRQRLNSPEALALKQQQWQAALKGIEPGEEWGRQMRQLMSDAGEPEGRIEEPMHEAVQQILELLDDRQLRRVAETPPQQLAIELMEALREQRASPPARWQEWKQRALTEAIERLGQEGEQAASLQASLGALFDRFYNMPTGEFFAQQERLEQELLATLELQEPPSREALLERGRQDLMWMFFEARRPVYLLEQYAAAIGEQ